VSSNACARCLGAVVLANCALAACHAASPHPLEDAANAPSDTTADALPDAPPDAQASAAPCTLAMPASGFTGPLTGQCAASWRAMDAGSVTNFTHHAFTVSGIAADTPWSVSDMGVLNEPIAVYTLDVRVGAQVWHVTGPLAAATGPAPGSYWTSDGGVALHLTAGHIEYYAFGHFDAENVHGSFDMDEPVVLHARF